MTLQPCSRKLQTNGLIETKIAQQKLWRLQTARLGGSAEPAVMNEQLLRRINITLKKTFGLWIYKEEKKKNIRCLCPKCLKDYIHNPDYIVRRLDPFAKVKDHCDKCNQSGWDYVIAERQHNARGKGCQNV